MDLSDKSIVITGGSRGIGLAIAEKFASSGANVAVLAKQDSLPEDIFSIDVDVCDESALRKAIETVIAKFQGVDILVNNTSATCFTDTQHTTPKMFDLSVSTSVRAAFFLS